MVAWGWVGSQTDQRRWEKSPALDRENLRGDPGWRELEESSKERDLVRDWSGKEGKTMNAGGVGELDRRKPWGGQGPPTNHTRGLAARRLFRVAPRRNGTIYLQTSMSSPGFKPRPYGTVVIVDNHYTGWATHSKVHSVYQQRTKVSTYISIQTPSGGYNERIVSVALRSNTGKDLVISNYGLVTRATPELALPFRGSLVVKVTDSGPACHEFEPGTAENSPYREAMHFESAECSNVLLLVVVW
ncbi:hypothetical protein TNCV_687751 [Trichonephila clavipes]|nr:hypothetical protein TNCV_687751 [Trichonephila clavipes]